MLRLWGSGDSPMRSNRSCNADANRVVQRRAAFAQALATALAPQIGYAAAAEISKRSVKEGVLIRDLVKRESVIPANEVDEVNQYAAAM